MNDKCPFCRSILIGGTIEGTLDTTNPIEWDCGTVLKSNIVLPSEECKERTNKRMEIKKTDVNEYVSMLNKIDPFLPVIKTNKVEKPLSFECNEEFKPKVKQLMNKLGI
jgi:hypothetical protein